LHDSGDEERLGSVAHKLVAKYTQRATKPPTAKQRKPSIKYSAEWLPKTLQFERDFSKVSLALPPAGEGAPRNSGNSEIIRIASASDDIYVLNSKVLMMKIQWMGFVAAAGIVFSCNSFAMAGVIVSSPAPVASGPGLGFATVAAIVTLTPNNDNVPAVGVPDNNVAVPLKRFDSNGYIDLVFAVQPSAGVTEYQVSEFVDNNTGSPWTRYTMQLGFDSGANFQLSAPNDGLDFDAPNYDTPPSSPAFPFIATPNEDELVFVGGVHGAGAQPYSVRIDVPDVPLGRGPFGFFTLRQVPTAVPEPASFALIAIACGLAAGIRRRG
jgi:hypothetical protein